MHLALKKKWCKSFNLKIKEKKIFNVIINFSGTIRECSGITLDKLLVLNYDRPP